ncbi:MAG: hypothetical protein IAF02_11835 [Anaerolineae bacterium]|nr:hypothetical protein [Anaerolineae bacterium]
MVTRDEVMASAPPALESSRVTRLPQRSTTDVQRFLYAQAQDARRNVTAVRPFRRDEFGSGAASPSASHIQAANQFMVQLREQLAGLVEGLDEMAETAVSTPSTPNLQHFLLQKDRAGKGIKQAEKIWDFFFELFGQRQTRYANWLLAADRIGLDCYQATYTGLGRARTIPTPPPFTYMETGFTPATFRRNVRLTRLGKLKNPFPVVKLPYHRLVNPWSLGAIHHEVSHNLQNDLGLWSEVPRRIQQRLQEAGLEKGVTNTWMRWHKEIWADLCGLLLGGPAIVSSLIGVVAQSPRATQSFNPDGVHPTPYFRVFINLELLRRMGFTAEADAFHRLWTRLYPTTSGSRIPQGMLDAFPQASQLVVDTICFQPYAQLGDKSLIQVVHFRPAHQQMVAEAAQRLASGTDPGIIPARFLVGAARWALSNRLASPERIAANFYSELAKR